MDKTWKKVEREVARRIGGTRVPVTGRGRGSAPDIEHEWLSVEVKSRKSVPAWIREALLQAQASNISDKKLPVAFIHQVGMNHNKDLVVIEMKDFQDWFIGFPEPGNPYMEENDA